MRSWKRSRTRRNRLRGQNSFPRIRTDLRGLSSGREALGTPAISVSIGLRLPYKRRLGRIQISMNKNLLLSLAAVLMVSSIAFAQDPALLRPPKGAQVALIVFEDLQCPKCRIDSPLEKQAAKADKIPLERHDFPL